MCGLGQLSSVLIHAINVFTISQQTYYLSFEGSVGETKIVGGRGRPYLHSMSAHEPTTPTINSMFFYPEFQTTLDAKRHKRGACTYDVCKLINCIALKTPVPCVTYINRLNLFPLPARGPPPPYQCGRPMCNPFSRETQTKQKGQQQGDGSRDLTLSLRPSCLPPTAEKDDCNLQNLNEIRL